MQRRTTLVFSPADWPRTRFVRSRLWETVQAVRVLLHRRQQLHHRVWLESVDREAAQRALPGLVALNPVDGWVPDFLSPPPQAGDVELAVELATVASYPPERVAADLDRSLRSHPTAGRRRALEPMIANPQAALRQLVDELAWAWEALLAAFWPPVHELITADIEYRSREISRSGSGLAVAGLHPAVTWAGATVLVEGGDRVTLELAGRGLSLLPSAFAWPNLIVVHDDPWPVTLVYPARGIGDLWTAPPVPRTGLTGVLGSTRALLLTDLEQPATTTALAARHRLSPAAVSTHLARLHGAGLVTKQRVGKEVRYRRTPAAAALITAARR